MEVHPPLRRNVLCASSNDQRGVAKLFVALVRGERKDAVASFLSALAGGTEFLIGVIIGFIRLVLR